MNLYTAPISKRFWSYVVDALALMVASPLFFVPFGFVDSDKWPDWLGFTYLFVCVALVMFYAPLCETFFNGQTLGKKVFGIKVVREDGAPVSGVGALQRFLMLFFDLYATLGIGGLVCATISKNNQRFGDLLAGTLVVMTEPQKNLRTSFFAVNAAQLPPDDRYIYDNVNVYMTLDGSISPIHFSKAYRQIQCWIAALKTRNSDSRIIDFLECQLSSVHLAMFRRKCYTWGDLVKYTLQSVPRAVYECRWEILASLIVSAIAYAIGVYSQHVDTNSFVDTMGYGYYETTIDNINNGHPMGIYSSDKPWRMFFNIFWNNFTVGLKVYFMGIMVIFGPLIMLIENFFMIGVFDCFFAQQGLLAHALVTPNVHGVLELSSIVICGGAAFRLGTGWLFPGTMTRAKAWGRAARQSMMVMISTIPMWFTAAFIESFITRHTEWPPLTIMAIIFFSFVFILSYYVVLPIISRRK